MPEYPITISGPQGAAKFDPDPQPVSAGDSVFWSNQSETPHTIVIDNQPNVKPMPAPAWDCTSMYKVSSAVTYRCKDHEGESGSITIQAAVLLMMMLVAALIAPSLQAQVKCADLIGGELQPIDQIGDRDGDKVRGTLVATGEKQLIAFAKGTRPTGPITANDITCAEQWVRTYRKDTAANQNPKAPAVLPSPGPVIRARVGDLVQLTFVNLIDRINFPGTDTGKCDETQDNTGQIYPQTDTYPNCFHGSIFTNVHFHGTHTSPNSTGDNVFLELVPSPRKANATREPEVTTASVKTDFDAFYAACAKHLDRADAPQQWPKIWTDLPKDFRDKQDSLLSASQKKLYAANLSARANGAFPQNYVGAFPYCFRLPLYSSTTFPPQPMVAEHMTHTGGAGSTEIDEAKDPIRQLMMGQAPGTHWYHAHKHGSTTLNVSNGMTGVVIIEGAYDKEINDWYKARGTPITEHVIVLNQIGVTPAREGGTQGGPGPYFSVNGRLQPTVTMKPGEVQLWRIANTTSRSTAIFLKPSGVTWRQLAQDGVQFTDANYVASENQSFVLASGNRADLLVKAPSQASATFGITVQNSIDPTNDIPATKQQLLLNVTTTASTHDMPFMDRSDPAKVVFPPFLADIKDEDVNGRKTMVFSTVRDAAAPKFTTHQIDGKSFSGEVGALVLLNQIEEWKVVNKSFAPKIAHPFHIHINPFQVVEIFDPNEKLADGTPRYTTGTPGAGQCQININDESSWKPCAAVPKPSNIWRDVFSIPSGNTFDGKQVPGYFKLRSRFVDYAGYYVLHCHILSHEDRGMMTVVYVAPLQPPFSHH